MERARRIVIVGGVAGGASTAARARRLSEDAEIVLLERGPHVSFANCGLPYYLGGEITEHDSLLVQTPEKLHERFNLDVRTRHEVLRILEEDALEVRDLENDETFRLDFDELVLAVGAGSIRPPIPGIERAGHFGLRTIPEMDRIEQWIESRGARRAVVVGGGFIGIEAAEQLTRRGLEVSLVEAQPQVMAPLDLEMAAWLHQELVAGGVHLHLDDAVAAFEAGTQEEASGASTVVLAAGERLPADLVILALGVRPRVELAREAGIELGERGGIRVDEHMRTSREHVWAVGDVIEVTDPVTGRFSHIPLAGPANRQGRIVADNIFGGRSRYRGTLGTSILRAFELTAASTGANEKTLRAAGIPFRSVHVHPASHAGYYPGAERMAMKLLFAPEDGRLLGAQVVGGDGVDKRIDVLATALHGRMTVEDLAELELAYSPPFGSAKDPVNQLGMVAQNVLHGAVDLADWKDLEGLDDTRSVLLDVRSAAEREQVVLAGSLHIPLDDLRERLDELPRDREIVTYCRTGQRSYYAARVLRQEGFEVRSLSGSMRTLEPLEGSLGGAHPVVHAER